MKIFSTDQIREWDKHTLAEENISSTDLMERAASRCAEWIYAHVSPTNFLILCGTGNNGGDGLVIARQLLWHNCHIKVRVIGDPEEGSDDFRSNYEKLQSLHSDKIELISESSEVLEVDSTFTIVDCIFGTGLNREVGGWLAEFFEKINQLPNQKIAIDVPSGFFADSLEPQTQPVIHASQTLTFQSPKAAFFFAENFVYVGEFHVVDIGLSHSFYEETPSDIALIDRNMIKRLLKNRSKFSHKNSFGHLQVIAGSYGKIGAAILTSKAAFRAGCGLVTAYLPRVGYPIMQTAIPEVMCVTDASEFSIQTTSIDNNKSAAAIGPGLGQSPETSLALRKILNDSKIPMVLDADALNIIAHKHLLDRIPPLTILTPHAGECDRLFEVNNDSFSRLAALKEASIKYKLYFVLKGAHSVITTPDGNIFFNSTGNPGMATAGSGDVLTGIIGSLLAQGYSPEVSAIAGVFLHGLAGDFAATQLGEKSVIADDIINALSKAYLSFNN